MSRGPSAREIAAFLAALEHSRETGGDPADLADEKASLLERIANTRPDDSNARQVARDAADRHHDKDR
ncbi:hypothetical protein [Peterkaempfera griseoplana]|uniref:hypothetical protein n=1 Tax=Peterkaempfera griseoplana TaxID=66896 RepID=UPI0006E1C927|nr:hypothetical protein [Peterkaempfera griseoplana]